MSKVPDSAKLVFKGMIFDVYHWEQEMFDGTRETFEQLKRVNTVEIIATTGDTILLAREEQPGRGRYTTLFGGRCEEGEEPIESAKRELLEESGYESDDFELYKTYEPLNKIEWKIFVYVARNCKKVKDQHLDSGEKIDVLECDFESGVEIMMGKEFRSNAFVTDLLRAKVEDKNLENFKKLVFKS